MPPNQCRIRNPSENDKLCNCGKCGVTCDGACWETASTSLRARRSSWAATENDPTAQARCSWSQRQMLNESTPVPKQATCARGRRSWKTRPLRHGGRVRQEPGRAMDPRCVAPLKTGRMTQSRPATDGAPRLSLEEKPPNLDPKPFPTPWMPEARILKIASG